MRGGEERRYIRVRKSETAESEVMKEKSLRPTKYQKNAIATATKAENKERWEASLRAWEREIR